MNTHDKIELPPLLPADRYFEFDSHRMKASIDIPYWGEKSLEAYARAAIEADRKQHDRMLAHEWIRPALGLSEDAPYRFDFYAQQIEGMKADRKHKGEVVVTKTPEGEIIAVTRQDDEGRILSVIAEAESKRRGEPVLVGWAVGTTGGGLLHASKYTEYEARRAGYSLPLYRLTATQPAVQSDAEIAETCRTLGANSFAEFFGKTAPQPAEPGSTHHVHRGTESLPCYCNGTYDHPIGKETLEPVKVPSDDEIIELRSEFDWREHYGNIRFARALLARYSHLTATTHKSSNQNQLKG